jgi:hypothetical protein
MSKAVQLLANWQAGDRWREVTLSSQSGWSPKWIAGSMDILHPCRPASLGKAALNVLEGTVLWGKVWWENLRLELANWSIISAFPIIWQYREERRKAERREEKKQWISTIEVYIFWLAQGMLKFLF